MPKPKKTAQSSASKSSAYLGFEAKLWLTAEKLRNNMDAAEYRRALGLIFIKYISDTVDEHRAKLIQGQGEKTRRSADLLGCLHTADRNTDGPHIRTA